MAVCNLFKQLSNASGNFMLFSQYAEDMTHNYTEGDNYKIVPSKFVALNIDYSRARKDYLNTESGFNIGVPQYFQNYFENSCAYCRNLAMSEKSDFEWTPEISKNLFWNSMFDANLLHADIYPKDSETSNIKNVPEVMYYGDVNMHSYNEHKGMGYGEIYCYIPTNAQQVNCQVVDAHQALKNEKVEIYGEDSEISNINGRLFVENSNVKLEGHNIGIGNYPRLYFYNRDFEMSFDSDEIDDIGKVQSNKYKINTIVVLYSIFRKINDDWITLYSNIPMGMYITGKFDEDPNSMNINSAPGPITNEITKYVSTNYDTGTSYGLRICTRFSVASNGVIVNDSEITTDNSGYTNLCQLMTSMNENLSKMLSISSNSIDTTNKLKDILSIIKNNRVNVPYVKDVNGTDCWFVNGKFVSAVNKGIEVSCKELTEESVETRLENLMDYDENNDYTPIDTEDCEELSAKDLAKKWGLDESKYPDVGEDIIINYDCEHEVVTEEELNKEFCTASPIYHDCDCHKEDSEEIEDSEETETPVE